MTNVPHIQLQIKQHIVTLKRELDRLTVRQAAIERCRRSVLSQKPAETTDEDDESFDEIAASLDDIEYDLTTFRDQLRARLVHAEAGLRLVMMHSAASDGVALHQYILDGLKLCVEDASVARAGYDELIVNIKEITQLRDQ
jgi:hypothetical protein